MSISDLKEKIKSLDEGIWHNILVSLIIVAVAVSSFSIGRFSVEQGIEAQVLYPEEVVSRAEDSLNQDPKVVASARGTKYYYPWCSGAESLSVSNRVEFNSPEEAERAGYLPASNCDGPNQ